MGVGMYFNVAQLLNEPSGSVRMFQIDNEPVATDNGSAELANGTVRLMRTDKGIWVSFELESVTLCTCSRCLSDYKQPIRIVMEEESFPADGGRPGHPDYAEGTILISEHQTMDITEAIKQYSALVVPMKPICREDCAGICLDCGVNLNETSCMCDRKVRDHRWDALLAVAPSLEAGGRPER